MHGFSVIIHLSFMSDNMTELNMMQMREKSPSEDMTAVYGGLSNRRYGG